MTRGTDAASRSGLVLVIFVVIWLWSPLARARVEPAFDNLVCFTVRDDSHRALAAKFIERDQALAPNCRLAGRAQRLCVPAAATLSNAHEELVMPPFGDDPVAARLCYRVECSALPTHPSEVVSDRFGLHVLSRRNGFMLCNPTTVEPRLVSGGPRGASNPAGGPDAHEGHESKRPSVQSTPQPPAAQVSEPVLCGDFTGDNVVSASDALGVLRGVVGAEQCPVCVCDVDNSNSTVATDGLILLRFAVGVQPSISCASGGNPVSWSGGGDGVSWGDPDNWDIGDRVPNRCDDVTIGAGLASAVLHGEGDDEIGNLTADSELRIGDGELRVHGAVNAGVPVEFTGGALRDAAVVATVDNTSGEGLRFSSLGGTLTAVTVDGDLDLSDTAALIRVHESLALHGTARLGDFAQILFESGTEQTLSGNGTLEFIGDERAFISVGAGVELRITDGITLQGGSALVGGGTVGSRLINEGTIRIDGPGEIYVRSSGGWINQGSLRSTAGGNLHLTNTWRNDGDISISGGGRLSLEGAWKNRSTIQSVDSTVDLGGVFTLVTLGAFNRSGGTVRITGQLDNTTELLLDDNTGPWLLAGGTILGGSVVGSGSGELVYTITGGRLVGTTIRTGMNLTASQAFVRIERGLELHGTATLGPTAQILFQGIGQQILSGDGQIVLSDSNEGGFVNIANGASLVVAEGITIRGAAGSIGGTGLAARLINQGTISSDTPGTIRIIANGSGWENQGVIDASGGGSLKLEGDWVNRGEVSISGGGTLVIAGDWSNLGTISAVDSTVDLGGEFTLTTLGNFEHSGGTFNLSGTLDNISGLSLNDATGSWHLRGGTILGGSVTTSGDADLVYTVNGGTLDRVIMNSDMDLSAASTLVRIKHGITLSSIGITLGDSAQVLFEGVGEQTLGGSGELEFVGAQQGFVGITDGVTLKIGSGILIHGTTGLVGSEGVAAQIINDGTFDSDAPGLLRVRAGGGLFNNFQGTMRASVDEFRVDDILINDGKLEAEAGRKFVTQSDLTLRASSSVRLAIDAPDVVGSLEVNGAIALGGVLNLDIAADFDPSLGEVYTVVSYKSKFGKFITITGLDLGNGKRLQPEYTDNALELTVVAD